MPKKILITIVIALFVNTIAIAVTTSSPSLVIPHIDIVESKDKTRIINQLIDDSGMREIIEQLPTMVAMGFDQQPPPPINRDKYNKFRENYIQVFDPVKIRETVANNFNVQYEAKRFSELLALVNSPLAKKMTSLEVESSTPQAQQEMMQMGNIIMGQASPSRLELVQQLDEAMSATEVGVDMQMMMTEAMMANMNKIVSPAQQMTDEQLKQGLSQMRMQSLFPARQYTQLNFVYAYRTVSDADLKEYIQLYQSEIGRWSIKLMRNAWLEVSENVATDLAGRIQKEFIEENAL